MPMTGLEEVERDHIVRALEASNWVVGWSQWRGRATRNEADIAGLQDAEASNNAILTGATREPSQKSQSTRLI